MDDLDDPFSSMHHLIGGPMKLAPQKDDHFNGFDEEVDEEDNVPKKSRSKTKLKERQAANDDERRKTRQRQNDKLLKKFTSKKTASSGSNNKTERGFTEDEVLMIPDDSDDDSCSASPPKRKPDGLDRTGCSTLGTLKDSNSKPKRKQRITKKQHQVNAALSKINSLNANLDSSSAGDVFDACLSTSKIKESESCEVASKSTRSTCSKGSEAVKSFARNLDSDDSQQIEDNSVLSVSQVASNDTSLAEEQVISVRHISRAKTDRFIMKTDETFERIICKLIEAETAARNRSAARCRRIRCALTYQGVFVRASATLSDLDWNAGDQLEVAFVELIRLNFCTSEQHRKSTLECSSDVPFTTLLDRLAADLRVDSSSCITLLLDGDPIDLSKTPQDYEIEDDDRIDVHIHTA